MAWLTGRPAGPPLGGPAPLVEGALALARAVERRSSRLGRRVAVDPLALMAERAAVVGLRRRGATSCGGASRLLPCADGWTAVTLARPTDWELIPALLDLPGPVTDGDWTTVETGVADRGRAELREQAGLFGLPLALLGERGRRTTGPARARTVTDPRPTGGQRAAAAAAGGLEQLVVADLSTLWAGPLVGRLLRLAGARVVKVESLARPDGARHGPAPVLRPPERAARSRWLLDLSTPDGGECSTG